LENTTLDYLDRRNKKPKPLIWTAGADLIPGKSERLLNVSPAQNTRLGRLGTITVNIGSCLPLESLAWSVSAMAPPSWVPAALFVAAKDEVEFAGMLAHAMAHILERHGVQQPILQDRSHSANAPVTYILGGCCDSVGAFQVVPMGFLKLQHTLEREADLLALETMAHAGFDPNALVRYTERVQPRLPLKNDRIANMLSVIAKLTRTNDPAPPSDEFRAAREAMVRLLPQDPSTPPSLTRNPRQ
jgi:hypothetical protein